MASDLGSPGPNDGVSFWVPRDTSRYRLFVVRQADLEDIPTTVEHHASARMAGLRRERPARRLRRRLSPR